VVGLHRHDDLALGHAVEMPAVARIRRAELPRRAAAECLPRRQRLQRAQPQGLAHVLAVAAGEDHGQGRLAQAGLFLEASAQCGRAGGLVA
jgi:hypothetical protein